ncbi:MAG: TIGR01244 family sulfur transferase [Roseovarius sp.]|nr:TIGR01244 family sulfur transferase [Roseovarius sp.]
MDIRILTRDFAVSPQISVGSVSEIAKAGYRSILCNRPDGEQYGQCEYRNIAEAAAAQGLESRSVPLASGIITEEVLSDFATAMDELPKPILAYCRSGTRCAMLWSVNQSGKLAHDEIIGRTAAAGYDVANLLSGLGR